MPFLRRNFFLETLFPKKVPYKIISVLKDEGPQKVYKALRGVLPFEQEVILKIFSKSKREAFKAEWESLVQTHSLSCCVNLLSVEQFKGNDALVMESVKGVTLWELIRKTKLSKEENGNIIKQIYKGLKELKSLDLFHGDLSLNNILITEKGEVRFIDFGKGNQKTRGTAPFAAPEILNGSGSGWASDLFSLGVIEFFLENVHQLYSLKNKPSSYFISRSSLLYEDPEKRYFPEEKYKKKEVSYIDQKIRALLHLKEKCWQTEDIPQQKKDLSSLSFTRLALMSLIWVFMSLITSAPFSSGSIKKESLLKIHTKQWFHVTLNTLKGYTPLEVPLSSGHYRLLWKTREKQGEKLLYIPPGKTLVLNDRDFF